MRTVPSFLLLWLLGVPLLVHFFSSSGLAAPPSYSGEASVLIVQDDQAAARGRGIEGALREALEGAVAALLDVDVMLRRRQALESRLYARPWSYVRSYRILWEYPDGPYYRVAVEAEFALNGVRRTLAGMGLTTAPSPTAESDQDNVPPWLLVLITERHLGQSAASWPGTRGMMTRVLRSRFQRQGIRLRSVPSDFTWDGQDSTALAAARQLGVKAVLIGRAGVQEIYSAGTGSAVQASGYLQALDATTGEAFALERADATVLQEDKERANTQALQQVASTLAGRVLPALQTFQQRKVPRSASNTAP